MTVAASEETIDHSKAVVCSKQGYPEICVGPSFIPCPAPGKEAITAVLGSARAAVGSRLSGPQS